MLKVILCFGYWRTNIILLSTYWGIPCISYLLGIFFLHLLAYYGHGIYTFIPHIKPTILIIKHFSCTSTVLQKWGFYKLFIKQTTLYYIHTQRHQCYFWNLKWCEHDGSGVLIWCWILSKPVVGSNRLKKM